MLILPRVYPETKGVSLEDMDAVFGEGQPLTILFMKLAPTVLLVGTPIASSVSERSNFLRGPPPGALYPPNSHTRIQQTRTVQSDSNSDHWLGRLFRRNGSHRDVSEYQALSANIDEEVTMSRLDEGRVRRPPIEDEDVEEYEVVGRDVERGFR